MSTKPDRDTLLAQAQRLAKARPVDFAEKNRAAFDPKLGEMYRLAPDPKFRKRLAEAGFADVVQTKVGRAKEPFIVRIYPNGDAPSHTPKNGRRKVRERLPDLNVARRNAKAFFRYLEHGRERWMVEARRGLEREFGDVAREVNRIGFDRVEKYVRRAIGISSTEEWRRHLEDRFGWDTVEFYAADIGIAEEAAAEDN